jgi:hypothetical protein
MYVSSYVHFKSWMFNESIGFVHMQYKKLTIDKCGNPNKIQKVVAKIVSGRWNMRIVGWILNHASTPKLKHEKTL